MFYTSNEAVFKITVQGLNQKSTDNKENQFKSSLLPKAALDSLDPFSINKQALALKSSLEKSKQSLGSNQNEQATSAIDRLQVLAFEGFEGISTPYAFEVQLVNEHVRFDITQLLSKPVFLSFTPDESNGVHGLVSAVKRGPIDDHYGYFSIIITPRFKQLAKRTNQRIFLDKTVPDIIKVILAEYGILESTGFEFKFKEIYPQREYTTQYDETDEHFIQRLCQEEGIAYHFEFSKDNHLMVFTDAQPFFPSLKEAIQYLSDTGMVADKPVIRSFSVNLSSRTQTVTWRDYDFVTTKIPEGKANGTQGQKANGATEQNLEFYDYPGRYTQTARGDQLAKIQIERLRADHIVADGLSDSPVLHSGYYLTVEDHLSLASMDSKDPWLLNYIRHQGRQPQVLEAFGEAGSADSTTLPKQLHQYLEPALAEEFSDLQFPSIEFQQGYRNTFKATPKEVVWRPQRLHPKPKVLGSQTAIVTGPAGEEIYCDEYGRIKVQFHWDRQGAYDEHTSCWVRVASNWAHNGYGSIVIPRIGMEVMVNFLEGDPDQPLVVGALHNGVNKVPYDLPANKTRSVFKTSSSKGGVGSNEFRIEDKAGEEQIFVQAQKDFDQLTKNNHITQVNNNSHLQVQNEHSETIVKNRYTKNEAEEHHLTQLDRKTQIMGNDYKTVAQAEHTTIGTIQTIEAGQEIHLKAVGQIIIDGGLSLTLKAAGQHIVLNPAGIWMTNPQWTGGTPIEGTPSMPLPPMTKQYGVAGTTSKAVELQPAKIHEPPEVIKKIKFIVRPLPNLPGYREEAYQLYADGMLKQKGLTDQNGAILIDHAPNIKKYEIKLINGHHFTINMADQPDEITEADIAGIEGYRAFNHNDQHKDKLDNKEDYRLKARDPNWKKT